MKIKTVVIIALAVTVSTAALYGGVAVVKEAMPCVAPSKLVLDQVGNERHAAQPAGEIRKIITTPGQVFELQASLVACDRVPASYEWVVEWGSDRTELLREVTAEANNTFSFHEVGSYRIVAFALAANGVVLEDALGGLRVHVNHEATAELPDDGTTFVDVFKMRDCSFTRVTVLSDAPGPGWKVRIIHAATGRTIAEGEGQASAGWSTYEYRLGKFEEMKFYVEAVPPPFQVNMGAPPQIHIEVVAGVDTSEEG